MQKKARIFFLPFLKHMQVAQNTYSFFFDRSQTSFDFLPGQYIRMTLPHPNPDNRGTGRYFTIASSPLEKKYLMVTTKMVQSTFKETLHSLTRGKEVHFFGPMGKFVLDEKDTAPRAFISGGVGITPFHSMLTYVAKKKLNLPITLIAYFKNADEVIFYDELMKIKKLHQNLHIIYLLQKAANWKGETGSITQKLVKKYIPNFHDVHFSVVGSPNMVANTREVLEELKIRTIKTEDFTGY